jgi:type I restriction enzyme S subunit
MEMIRRTRRHSYSKYKPSGVDWLGEVPADWDVRRLSHSLEKVMDFRGRTPTKIGMEWGGDIPAISAINVRDGYIDLSAGVNYGSHALHDRWMTSGPTRRGDIIYTTEAPLGNVAQIPDDNHYILSQRVVLLRPHQERFDSAYLRYFLGSTAFRYGVDARATGSTAEGIKRRHLLSMPILEPSPGEQRVIAAFLDRETAKIDALIAKKEHLIKLLLEKGSALTTHIVTKGLDRSVPVKDSGIEWLGMIPADWDVMRLRHIGEAVIGLTYEPGDVSTEEDGVLVLRASNVAAGRIILEDRVYVRRDIPSDLMTRVDDILICSRSGSRALIGKNARIDSSSAGYTFGAFMTVFRSRLNDYLYYAFNSNLFEYQSASFMTSTINQLTISNLYDFAVPVPPPQVRRDIAEYLDYETRRLEALVARIKDAVERLCDMRSALISAAVTGKIDVREGVP